MKVSIVTINMSIMTTRFPLSFIPRKTLSTISTMVAIILGKRYKVMAVPCFTTSISFSHSSFICLTPHTHPHAVEKAHSKMLEAKNKSLSGENKKLRSYADTLQKLVHDHDEIMARLTAFCRERNINSAALWGEFMITKNIKSLLEEAGVKVDYIISSKKTAVCDRVVPINAASFPETDLIIVCDASAYEKRKEGLRSKTDIPVISISELIPLASE